MPIEHVIEYVPIKISANGFALLQTYNYHEVLASKGFPINRKVFIYEICKAKVAAAILESRPDFAPFMPCRIAIYENDATTCTISTPNMDLMISALPKDGGLQEEANAIYQTLKTIVQELA